MPYTLTYLIDCIDKKWSEKNVSSLLSNFCSNLITKSVASHQEISHRETCTQTLKDKTGKYR